MLLVEWCVSAASYYVRKLPIREFMYLEYISSFSLNAPFLQREREMIGNIGSSIPIWSVLPHQGANHPIFRHQGLFIPKWFIRPRQNMVLDVSIGASVIHLPPPHFDCLLYCTTLPVWSAQLLQNKNQKKAIIRWWKYLADLSSRCRVWISARTRVNRWNQNH